MKYLVAIMLLGSWAMGQVTINAIPSAPSIPVNGIQSLTAQTTNTNNHGVMWAITGGTAASSASILGSGQTVGVKSTATGVVIVTATSSADATKTDTSTITYTAAPTPVTGHPRLLVTAGDISRLRGWYVAGNPIYEKGYLAMLNTSLTTYTNPHWSWTKNRGTGLPDATWIAGDTGSAGFLPQLWWTTEAHAFLYAFSSMMDSNATNRANYQSQARDMLMWVMNKMAACGASTTGPFCAANWGTSERIRNYGFMFPLIVDWLQCTTACGNSAILTTADKNTISTAFHRLAKQALTSGVTTSQWPLPVGVTNNVSVLNNTTNPLRWAMNNHSIGSSLGLLLESLALDDNATDDPTLTSCNASRGVLCTDGTASSLRAYLTDYTGAWLLRQWAEYEDSGIVRPAYATWLGASATPPTPFGEGAGGESFEGNEYDGSSLGGLFLCAMALHTAGLDDPAVYGPQVNFVNSTYWDLHLQQYFAELMQATTTYNTGTYGTITVPQYFNYADSSRFYFQEEVQVFQFNIIAAFDNLMGNSARSSYAQFIPANYIAGSAGSVAGNLMRNSGGAIWGSADVFPAWTFFMADDPNNAPADPRSTYPPDYVAQWGRYMGRDTWSTNNSILAYKCSFLTIDHQNGDCGMIEWNRKNDWLIKEQVSYDLINYWGSKPEHHNIVGIQNTPAITTGFQGNIVASTYGGQFSVGVAAGDPTTLISYSDKYAHAYSDSTNLYNDPSKSNTGVTHASRSMVWLKPDYVVIYDRAVTSSTGLFKHFNLQFPGSAVNSGATTTETMGSGQKLYIQTLLPASGLTFTVSVADGPANGDHSIAEGDPVTNQLQINDGATPLSERYLNVLQGADSGKSQIVPTLVQSSSGTGFDGAVVGTTDVLFINDVANTAGMTTTTYTVANTVTHHYLSGLRVDHTYYATITPSGGNNVINIANTAGGIPVSTDNAGLLGFASSSNVFGGQHITGITFAGGSRKTTPLNFGRGNDMPIPILNILPDNPEIRNSTAHQ